MCGMPIFGWLPEMPCLKHGDTENLAPQLARADTSMIRDAATILDAFARGGRDDCPMQGERGGRRGVSGASAEARPSTRSAAAARG